MTFKPLSKEEIAKKVANDLKDGQYVNLGIGLPTLVASFLPDDKEIVLHSENGVLGVGPRPLPGEEDIDLIDAGKDFITLKPGASIFHHTDSFIMMRGGHIDVAVLGALQVSQKGDLANWATNDETYPPAVGGAMDLASGAKKIFVIMIHTTKEGIPKILNECTFPLTATAVVTTVYTDLATLDVIDGQMFVREMSPGLSKSELIKMTGAKLNF
jgi:3-oxoadipate CoA-transferase beta subunit